MTSGTQSWHERLWRANNAADIARGLVPGAAPFAAFGENQTVGAVADRVLWETGMPDTLAVPNGVSMTFASSAADARRLRLVYLDGDLLERSEIVTLDGTTPVLTAATDIRFVNRLYSLDGPALTTVLVTQGGTTYARIDAGQVQFSQAVYRVPAQRRLMITALYAGSVSGTATARTTVKIETTFINGDSFAAAGILHPIGAAAAQDSAATLAFDPLPVPAGEIVAMTFKTDKAADIVGGWFGWVETL